VQALQGRYHIVIQVCGGRRKTSSSDISFDHFDPHVDEPVNQPHKPRHGLFKRCYSVARTRPWCDKVVLENSLACSRRSPHDLAQVRDQAALPGSLLQYRILSAIRYCIFPVSLSAVWHWASNEKAFPRVDINRRRYHKDDKDALHQSRRDQIRHGRD
jgi:hypothetical protein